MPHGTKKKSATGLPPSGNGVHFGAKGRMSKNDGGVEAKGTQQLQKIVDERNLVNKVETNA